MNKQDGAMPRGHFVEAAAASSAQYYGCRVGTLDAGSSGCRVFDGAGVLRQLNNFHLPNTSRSKVGE